MKITLLYLSTILIALTFASCGDDDNETTVPVVVTGTVVNITTTSGTISSTIKDNGNSTITEAGVVYSSNVNEPTVADNKVKSITTSGEFSVNLDGLTSGTVYHVRAYATNAVGTGYGKVIDFVTGNAGPVISNVVIVGVPEVGNEVSVTYDYSDAEEDMEGVSTYQWYVANDAAGNGESSIVGAIERTFVIQDAQDGKFLRVAVTPLAVTGTTIGTEVKSTFVGAVGEATTVMFVYNGEDVTYGIISSESGKKWMDRNLGAERVAQAVDDYLAYGDMFQWGRAGDGHQLVERKGGGDSDVTGENGTTSERSSDDSPETNKFITDTSPNGDWRAPQNSDLWQGSNGINNPCPSGWRIPTKQEWLNEGITSSSDAYTKLKLTYSGFRSYSDGNVVASSWGTYWSSTIEEQYAPQLFSFYVYFDGSSFAADFSNRGNGMPCRCIKD
jgi:uncharacterized protein (TIGR02145 family)